MSYTDRSDDPNLSTQMRFNKLQKPTEVKTVNTSIAFINEIDANGAKVIYHNGDS